MLETLLSDGCSYHGTECERRAAELEAAAGAPTALKMTPEATMSITSATATTPAPPNPRFGAA